MMQWMGAALTAALLVKGCANVKDDKSMCH